MPRFPTRAALAMTLATGVARAADGDLDLSFGDGTLIGWSKPSFDVGAYPSEHLAGLFFDVNGSYYLLVGKVCTSADCATFDIGIVRLRHGGAIDTSYGTNGYVRTAQNLLGDITAVERDGSGRFIVVGPTAAGVNADTDFGVLRLMPDGTYDNNFAYAAPPLGNGSGGSTSIDFGLGGGDVDLPASVVLGTGDSIYIAGSVQISQLSYDVGVAKLTPSGYPDSTFGNGGRAHFNFGSSAAPFDSHGTSMLIDNAATVLTIAGTAQQSLAGNRQFALARYLIDGSGFYPGFCANGSCAGGNAGRMLIPAAKDPSRLYVDMNPRLAKDASDVYYLGGTVLGYAQGQSQPDTDVYIKIFNNSGPPPQEFQLIPHSTLSTLKVSPTRPPINGPAAAYLVYAGKVLDDAGGSHALVGRYVTGYVPDPDTSFAPPFHYEALTPPHSSGELQPEGIFSAILFDGPRIVLGGDTFYCCSNTSYTNYDFVATRLVDDGIFGDGFELIPN
jgi:hypothetical protein